jgi:hypothetical protein
MALLTCITTPQDNPAMKACFATDILLYVFMIVAIHAQLVLPSLLRLVMTGSTFFFLFLMSTGKLTRAEQ